MVSRQPCKSRGAIFANRYSSIVVHDTTFSANKASQSGGAVAVQGGFFDCWQCTFAANETQDRKGGAIYIKNSKPSGHSLVRGYVGLMYSTLKDNKAATEKTTSNYKRGNAIYVVDSADLSVYGTVFDNEGPAQGGYEIEGTHCKNVVSSGYSFFSYYDTRKRGSTLYDNECFIQRNPHVIDIFDMDAELSYLSSVTSRDILRIPGYMPKRRSRLIDRIDGWSSLDGFGRERVVDNLDVSRKGADGVQDIGAAERGTR